MWPALLVFGVNYQSHVVELTDKDLSYFLTNDVVIGVIVGLGQPFLMFASIQCNNANDDWRQRNRTLINKAGETKPLARAHNALCG